MQQLETIVAQAADAIAAAASGAELEQAKARYLGKAGSLTELLKGLGRLSAEERPRAGAAINAAPDASEPRAEPSCGEAGKRSSSSRIVRLAKESDAPAWPRRVAFRIPRR